MKILFFLFYLIHLYEAKCPPGTYQGLSNTDCYFVSTDTASWYDAEQTCTQKGGHLASVSSQLTNAVLMQYTQECAASYWLGGTWTYRNGWIWSDGQRFQYTDWADGEPNTDGNYCLYIGYNDTNWHSLDCSTNCRYVCKVPAVASELMFQQCDGEVLEASAKCPNGWSGLSMTNKCHKVVHGTVVSNAIRAREECLKLNATLPTIHSDEENNWLTVFAMESGVNDSFFLGHDASSIREELHLTNQTKPAYDNWHFTHNHNSREKMESVMWLSMHDSPIGSWVVKEEAAGSSIICQITV